MKLIKVKKSKVDTWTVTYNALLITNLTFIDNIQYPFLSRHVIYKNALPIIEEYNYTLRAACSKKILGLIILLGSLNEENKDLFS